MTNKGCERGSESLSIAKLCSRNTKEGKIQSKDQHLLTNVEVRWKQHQGAWFHQPPPPSVLHITLEDHLLLSEALLRLCKMQF